MVLIKKKKKHGGMAALFISTIAMLNLLGISYAFWEDEINMFVEISTANFEVAFDDNTPYILSICEDSTLDCMSNNDSHADGFDMSYDDANRELNINAYIFENMKEIITQTKIEKKYSAEYSEFEGTIPFSLINKGDVPVECTYKNIIVDDGLNLSLYNIPNSLAPMEYADDPYLYIKAGEGTYNFEIELQYSNKY